MGNGLTYQKGRVEIEELLIKLSKASQMSLEAVVEKWKMLKLPLAEIYEYFLQNGVYPPSV